MLLCTNDGALTFFVQFDRRFPFFRIVLSLDTDSVYAGCTDVAMMCIWDTAATEKKACNQFGYGGTKTVCRKSGNYKISYEMVVYSTFQGFNPCFEVEGNDCPELLGLYIKECNVSLRRPKCTERTELKWRFFSFGNRVASDGKDGIGKITGREYVPGTYEITTQTLTDSSTCDDDSLKTTTLILRSKCQGDEDFVLT
jgi:hypothetical protein